MDRVERTRPYVVDDHNEESTDEKIDGSFEEIMRHAVGIKQTMVKKRYTSRSYEMLCSCSIKCSEY